MTRSAAQRTQARRHHEQRGALPLSDDSLFEVDGVDAGVEGDAACDGVAAADEEQPRITQQTGPVTG